MTRPAAEPDWTRRPAADEYGPGTASYVGVVPDGDLLSILERGSASFAKRARAVPAERETYRYGPDKWTIREVVGHCIDAERVVTLRALWFARSAPTSLPGFEEDDWARASNAGDRPLRELVEEWEAVRRATLFLFRSLDAEAIDRRGIANGVNYTVRGLAWVVAGHGIHHEKVLEQRYQT